MAIAETARLIASLELQDKLSKPADKAIGKLGKLEGAVGRIGSTAAKGVSTAAGNIAKIGAIGAVAIGSQVKFGLDSLAQLESATTAVDAAIKQMGQSGQVTAKQVAGWANEIESSVDAAFDDKDITRAAATLIRFGKVTPRNLRQTLTVMTDLATKTGSVDSAATLLARALADPTKAAGKLARAGVILTKSQQAQIKAYEKAGNAAAAQKVVLDALTQSTKGAAKASAGEYQDSINILADVTEDAQRALAIGFLPVLTKVRDILSKELGKPSTLAAIKQFGESSAKVLESLIGVAQKLPWEQIGNSLKIAGQGSKAILDAFLGLPPWVQTAVLTGWGLNKLTGGAIGSIASELGKGVIKGVLGMNAGVVNIKAGVVTGVGGAGSAAGGAASKVGGIGKSLLGFAKAAGSLALLAIATDGLIDEFGRFQGKLAKAQIELKGQVDATANQSTKQSIDNLNATVDGIKKLPIWDQAIALTAGGQQISEDLVSAAQRLVDAKALTRDELQSARDAIDKARSFAAGNLLGDAEQKLVPLLASIDQRIADQPTNVGLSPDDRGKLTNIATSILANGTLVTRAVDSESNAVQRAINEGTRVLRVATKAQVDQFHRVEARLAKERTDPFRFIKREAQQGDSHGGILPAISSLVRSFTEGRTPWARDLGKMKSHLQNLKDAEAAFRAKGDTKTADAIKGQIKILQGVINTKQTATNEKLDKIVSNTTPKQGPRIAGSADTGSESSGTRLNSSPAAAAVTVDTKPVVTAITTEGTTTRQTISSTAAGAQAAIAGGTAATVAQGAATRQTIASTAAASTATAAATKASVDAASARSEASAARLNASQATTRQTIASTAAGAAAANAAQEAQTRATIRAGDTRSEGAMARLQGAAVSSLASVRGATNGVATAVRNKKLSVSQSTNITIPVTTNVSARGIVRTNAHVARFNNRSII